MIHNETPSYDHPQNSKLQYKTSSYCSDIIIFLGATLVSFLLIWSIWCFNTPITNTFSTGTRAQIRPDPITFYDDPEMGYTLETQIQNWDEKRKLWLAQNPGFSGPDKVVMVTGSQPGPCENPVGDNYLLRFFKNKVDYCRIHGYNIFYNNVLLDSRMFTFWAKYPVLKSAMLAHPEAEWLWWVDSDAAITDMGFTLPLERYKAHNLVFHGWPNLVFEKKSWTGLNAGVFLIRNCQWSMDLLDKWAKFGPISPEYKKWGEILKSVFTDKLYAESDDQTGIAYLMVKEGQKWNDKIYLEKEYYFEGYWVDTVGKLENITVQYNATWKDRENVLDKEMKKPFITHFTGCEPCSGNHNEIYSMESCYKGMNLALNFADNQVLRNYGYFRPDLFNTTWVQPLRF